MDISLIHDFKQTINNKLDEILLGIIEQYNSEISKLEEVILSSTSMIQEKEDLIKELKEQLDENNFNEENFNKFSIIQNLNKQVNDLSRKNELLETSIRVRNKSQEPKENLKLKISNNANEIDDANANEIVDAKANEIDDANEIVEANEIDDANETEVIEAEVNEAEVNEAEVNETEVNEAEVNETEVNEAEVNEAEVNETEVNEAEVNETEVNETEVNETEVNETEVNETEVNETEVNESEVNETEVNDDQDNTEEEEIEVEEIIYKEKTYYVKDGMVYNKKKNGDIGKEVGSIVNGKPKLNRKKKKDKKDN